MKISIITSCFNRVTTIRACIESVLAQSYDDIEYIVVDGGSTDGSREIIDEYRDRIDRIVYKKDRGMYEGINNGIREATGDVIALCHSDDRMYAKDTVARVAEFLEKTGADIVAADGLFLRRRNYELDEPARVWKSGPMTQRKFALGWLPLHTTCYIRKSVYDKFGLYDESYSTAADTKFLIEVLGDKDTKYAYLPLFVTKMRMGGLSTDRRRFQAVANEDFRVFTELGLGCPRLRKALKMMWKVPQYVRALLHMNGTRNYEE